ncbi:lipoprotein [Patulibacter medicamentivorans]|uniref:Lipoprotein n=1 Tax=Patulibacter medicamentivorans TaxID=1097667 RepID=H0E5C2_9ACTN|nr:DUF4097 family beta strand repeat-containing protein [Patulibacter medicamentivorans]EHN11117.1 lipoprotein [Patulibacter medicamentivorans]
MPDPLLDPETRPRGLPPALIAIGVIGGIAMLLLTAMLLVLRFTRETSTEEHRYRGISALTIAAHDGDIELVTAPAGAPLRVEERITKEIWAPKVHRERTGSRLRLRSECPAMPIASCEIRFRVEVPAGTAIDVSSDSGDVVARGLRSDVPVSLRSDSGELRVESLTAPALRLDADSGDVRGDELRVPDVVAKADSGEVDLALTVPLRRLSAIADSGDVRVALPDAVYALTASTDSGDVHDDGVRRDPRSSRRVELRTDSGDVRIEVRR